MKKISFMLVTLFLGLTAMAQPVVDNAIIPVSVNLNSILRLNVTSGGNIEFTVNNIDQYTSGIVNSDNYDTKFTVASSVDFNVLMYAEGGFMGTDGASTAFDEENVGYILAMDAAATGLEATNYTFITSAGNGINSNMNVLSTTSTTAIITGLPGFSAGSTAQNSFIINWELATPEVDAESSLGSLMSQSIAPDRYTTNVFLVLDSQ
jgi:hypothetical protein